MMRLPFARLTACSRLLVQVVHRRPVSPCLRLPLRFAAVGSLCLSAQAFAQGAFTLTSTSLDAGRPVSPQQVYDRSGCGGANQSPSVAWHGAPAGTRSFAITFFDPDAPGRGWWHWAVASIPPNVDHLPVNASARGFLKNLGAIEARNDFGDTGYSGPCPPPGKPHRYVLTVYALNTMDLPLAAGRPAAIFEHEVSLAALATAKLVVTYGR